MLSWENSARIELFVYPNKFLNRLSQWPTNLSEREKAEIGVLITFEDATKPMRTEAAAAGFYKSLYGQDKYPRLQILTIAELLDGKGIAYPQHSHNVIFKRAPRAETPQPEQFAFAVPVEGVAPETVKPRKPRKHS